MVIGLVLAIPLIFWRAHQARREAEPLIRFVRDSIAVAGPKPCATATAAAISEAFTLEICGESRSGPVTADAIYDSLLALGPGDHAILASAPERYMQTVFRDGGYLLEMRDGNRRRHFEGARQGAVADRHVRRGAIFTFEEALDAFTAYASEAPVPDFLLWKPLHLAR
ncbi:MAG TPA: hypothetical protein VF552_16680 [Allosphingosinicella sp.]|jgi:hypothetical protein